MALSWFGRVVCQSDWEGSGLSSSFLRETLNFENVRSVPPEIRRSFPLAASDRLFQGRVEEDDAVFLVDLRRGGRSFTIGALLRPEGRSFRVAKVFDPEALARYLLPST